MKVADLKPAMTVTTTADESLRAAAKHLADDDIGVLVVVSGASGLLGILSERDLARAVADDADLDAITVGEYMTRSPVTTAPDAAIGDVIAKMNEFGVRHVVVANHGDPVGVVSIRDLVGLLGTTFPEL